MEKVKKRVLENKKRKDEIAIQQAEREKQQVLIKILNHGGVYTTKQYLDDLIGKPIALENLSAHIQ